MFVIIRTKRKLSFRLAQVYNNKKGISKHYSRTLLHFVFLWNAMELLYFSRKHAFKYNNWFLFGYLKNQISTLWKRYLFRPSVRGEVKEMLVKQSGRFNVFYYLSDKRIIFYANLSLTTLLPLTGIENNLHLFKIKKKN